MGLLRGASERPLLRSSFNSLDEDHESGRIRGGVGERKVLSEGSPAPRAPCGSGDRPAVLCGSRSLARAIEDRVSSEFNWGGVPAKL